MTTVNQPLLTIVIPAYNEHMRLPATLATVQAYVTRTQLDAEVIVADDGSSCLLYTSPSPRDGLLSRMPSSA